ncbi:carbohydrate ABC transporter permease [Paenibacillus sp. IB182496]|uniref:Carbohydrate ABC transporter permease n=1 Tax=Paenibacillus sabuli TaxID=2772509 RepID=A0A927BXC7_9BACL|nr:carbohydrate ABC transporter permease [Paenibacillus sabuli]MBD2847179.1 carbohydrate ABC transporter permease [Paenibacillus sabuli]
MRKTTGDKVFDLFNIAFMLLLLLIVLYPLYFIVIASFSNPDRINAGEVWIWVNDYTLKGYHEIFQHERIWTGYRNTIIYMVVGTLINVVITLTGAYPLSRSDFYGRKFFMLLIVFTMFFSGGLIPMYLLVKNLGMVNTIWAMILPQAVSAWNLIIARTFFQNSISNELREAAAIDGCSNLKFFLQIVIPLSKAITAVMVLFYGVTHWNSYFQALIYLRNEDLYPLQLVLRDILILSQSMSEMMADQDDYESLGETIKYGVIIMASVPMLVLYPFLQKYFVKGVMIGSLKG